MTLTLKPKVNKTLGSQIPESIRNVHSAMALKRYLDLTLTGTKKNLAQHGLRGRKGHPPSPYSFDKPGIESSIRQALDNESDVSRIGKPPKWVQHINERICKHSGEAPMFSESLLSSKKCEQLQHSNSRPLSGISTKSAPVVINGEMYYRPNKTHSYLQASSRPYSAKEDRETRASVLRNKHRMQAMSALPSNDTQMRLRELKKSRPRTQQLNKDLLPIPSHTGESPHSFLIGARYNCCNHMDARSYARLGLYVPRDNPRQTFLKIYRGDDTSTELGSDTDYVGNTSVRIGNESNFMQSESPFAPRRQAPNRSMPPPHVRRVVREDWLGEQTDAKPPPYKPPSVQRRSPTSFSKASSASEKRKTASIEPPAPNRKGSKPTPDSLRSRSRASKKSRSRSLSRTNTPNPSRINVRGQPVPSSTDLDARSRTPVIDRQAELE